MLLVRRPNLTKTITKSSTRHQSIRSPNEVHHFSLLLLWRNVSFPFRLSFSFYQCIIIIGIFRCLILAAMAKSDSLRKRQNLIPSEKGKIWFPQKKANGSICDSTKAKKSNSILGRSKTFIEKRKKVSKTYPLFKGIQIFQEHVCTVVDVKVSKIHIVTDRQNNRKNDRQFSLIPPDTDKETGTLWKKLKKVAK